MTVGIMVIQVEAQRASPHSVVEQDRKTPPCAKMMDPMLEVDNSLTYIEHQNIQKGTNV